MAKAYMGKTGIVLFSVALAIFALLNAISTFTRYAPLSAIYLSRDLGYVWIGASIVSLVGAGVAQKEGKWRGRTDILSWYHFTVIEVAIFTLGVLFAYLVLGYKDHRLIQPGPYILYGVGFLLEVCLIRHTWLYRREA